jgi:hypothetical protein
LTVCRRCGFLRTRIEALPAFEPRSRSLKVLELLIVVALGRGDGRVAEEIAHLRQRDAFFDQAGCVLVPQVIDDLGMRKLPHTAAEDLLEVIMRRYERASTLLTSNRPVDDWGKLLGDTAAVTALLDRLLPSCARAQVWAAQLAYQSPD